MLASLLFILYINDINEKVHAPLLKFSDDTYILRQMIAANDHLLPVHQNNESHAKKIFKPLARLNFRKNFFNHKLVDSSEVLSEEVINSLSVRVLHHTDV